MVDKKEVKKNAAALAALGSAAPAARPVEMDPDPDHRPPRLATVKDRQIVSFRMMPRERVILKRFRMAMEDVDPSKMPSMSMALRLALRLAEAHLDSTGEIETITRQLAAEDGRSSEARADARA